MGDLEKVLTNLSNEVLTWEDICKEYPEHKTKEEDAWLLFIAYDLLINFLSIEIDNLPRNFMFTALIAN